MSPVDLSHEEWEEINSQLPDVVGVCNRIRTWPRMDESISFDLNLLKRIRVSHSCFYAAANTMGNARYALGQAVGVRKYFLNKSQNERDNDHLLADIRSRFYADYVSLLLVSCIEHTCTGIINLYSLILPTLKKGENYTLRRLCKALEMMDLEDDNQLWRATEEFDANTARAEVTIYRNNWVHNDPPRVDSVFYVPPREHFVRELNNDFPWSFAEVSASLPSIYRWDDLIKLFSESMLATAKFLGAATASWERAYLDSDSYRSFDEYLADNFVDDE